MNGGASIARQRRASFSAASLRTSGRSCGAHGRGLYASTVKRARSSGSRGTRAPGRQERTGEFGWAVVPFTDPTDGTGASRIPSSRQPMPRRILHRKRISTTTVPSETPRAIPAPKADELHPRLCNAVPSAAPKQSPKLMPMPTCLMFIKFLNHQGSEESSSAYYP
jgi:hypothetical protein